MVTDKVLLVNFNSILFISVSKKVRVRQNFLSEPKKFTENDGTTFFRFPFEYVSVYSVLKTFKPCSAHFSETAVPAAALTLN